MPTKFWKSNVASAAYEVSFLPVKEQRDLFWEVCREVLNRGRFNRFKGTRAWRVLIHQTDVLELRFLSDRECAGIHHAVQSAFVVDCGTYFNFIPTAHDDRLTHVIPGLVTPQEQICHVRFRVERAFDCPLIGDRSVWSFEISPPPRTVIQESLAGAIQENVLARFAAISTAEEFFAHLNGERADLCLGQPGSARRDYLAGFTALHLGNRAAARKYLERASSAWHEMLKIPGVDHEAGNTLLWREACAIDAALRELDHSNCTVPADAAKGPPRG